MQCATGRKCVGSPGRCKGSVVFGIRGKTRPVRQADPLAGTVFEGVALNSAWLLGAVEKYTKRAFPSLAFVGGGDWNLI